MIVTDCLRDRASGKEIDRLTIPDPLPNLRGGNPKRETGQMPSSKARRQGLFRLARTGNDNEFDQAPELTRIAPFRQLGGVIAANQVKHFGIGKSRFIMANGVDRIGNTAALQLQTINLAKTPSREGQTEHLDAHGPR